VSNAQRCGGVTGCGNAFEVCDLAFCLEDLHLVATIDQRASGAVIPTIFESVQPGYQYWVGLLLAYVSYYSAHCRVMLVYVVYA
jgi:hypothetical protein